MNDFPAWAGTVPGWLTAGSVTTILGMWLRYLKQRRDQDGVRLTDLEDENRQLRAELAADRKACREETDALWTEIRKLRAV